MPTLTRTPSFQRQPYRSTCALVRPMILLTLAIVGGMVRDVFLRRTRPDVEYDLATDARPEQVRQITARWADTIWETGIEFGTVGMRRGDVVCEITTYRSDEYQPESRKPGVTYGRSLEADQARRDFTVNAIAARLPSLELVDPFDGLGDLAAGRFTATVLTTDLTAAYVHENSAYST